jgi:hypothetical protein
VLKWVLIIVAVIVGLVAVLALVGLLLPKGHVASRTVRLRQPPEAVWRVLTAYAEHPAWRTDLERVERLADREGRQVWNEVHKDGSKMPMETMEAVPPQRLVRRIADPDLPFGGTWTFELAPQGDGCALTITERGEVYNPIFRTMSKFFDLRRSIDDFLHALGTRMGEEVTLED